MIDLEGVVWSEWFENTGEQPVDGVVVVQIELVADYYESSEPVRAMDCWWGLGKPYSIARYRHALARWARDVEEAE